MPGEYFCLTQQRKLKQLTAAALEAGADRGQVRAGIPSGGEGRLEEGGARARPLKTHRGGKVIWICGYFQHPRGKSPRLLLHSAAVTRKHLSPTSSSDGGGAVNVLTQLSYWGAGSVHRNRRHCATVASWLHVPQERHRCGDRWALNEPLSSKLGWLISWSQRFDALIH